MAWAGCFDGIIHGLVGFRNSLARNNTAKLSLCKRVSQPPVVTQSSSSGTLDDNSVLYILEQTREHPALVVLCIQDEWSVVGQGSPMQQQSVRRRWWIRGVRTPSQGFAAPASTTTFLSCTVRQALYTVSLSQFRLMSSSVS